MLERTSRPAALADHPAKSEKTRVFISYSRKDATFANWLRSGLEGRGIEVFRDIEDTLAGEEWWRRLQALISQADTVIFVLSPNSVASAICRDEVAHALKLNKRVFPAVIADINWALAPEGLIKLHGLFFNDSAQREAALTRLTEALETDIGWIREHTRLGELAQHWDRQKRPRAILLRGAALEDAERWLTERPKTARAATNLQQEYIRASRRAARQRLRVLVAISVGTAISTTMLGAGAYVQMLKAQENQRKAELERSRVLTEFSNENLRNGDPVTAALLAVEALPDASGASERPYYPPAELALRKGLREQRERLVFGGDRLVRAAAFSPDERFVVTAVNDGTVRIWDTSTGKLVSMLTGEKNFGSRTVTYSPDHERILVGDDKGNARVFDAADNRLIHTLRASSRGLRVAAFGAEGRLILTAGLDNAPAVWDGATGELRFTLIGHDRTVESAAFSLDGRRIVTASHDMTARIWDAETGQGLVILRGHEDRVGMAVFSPDGQRVLTASDDKTARLWDAVTGAHLGTLSGHNAAVLYAAFSPDGRSIITGSSDRTGRIWDSQLGGDQIPGARTRLLLGHSGNVHLTAFDKDSERALTVSNDLTVRVWKVETGEQLAILKGHVEQITSAVFGTRSNTVLTASEDGSTRIWDLDAAPLWMARWKHNDPVVFADFSSDGQLVVTTSEDDTARIWNALTGELAADLKGHQADVVSAAFSPNSKHVVTASRDGTARIWDTSTGEELHKLEVGGEVNGAVYSPDGRQILTASNDGSAAIWDSADGSRIKEFKANKNGLVGATFSPDGRRILTCSSDRTARIWDVKSARMIVLAGHTGECRSAVFSPGGSRTLTAGDVTARLWDSATGQPVTEFPKRGTAVSNRGSVISAAFDHSGRFILTVTTSRPFVHVWNIASGQVVNLASLGDPVTRAVFSPGDDQVLTVSNDGTLRLWDARSGAAVDELQAHEGQILHATFSFDGQRMLTTSKDETARLWQAFVSKKDLLDFAESKLSRCLHAIQRERFGLDNRAPSWCKRLGKWPSMPEAP
jgi:WD40 repeat protein